MTVAYVSVTAITTGTTTVTPNLPASLATGDGVLIQVICKPDTATINTPAGWTLVANVAGGGGTVGNSIGPSQQAWFFREKDASWSTMPTISITGGTSSVSAASRYTKASGTMWDVAAATGVWGTSATTTNASTTLGSDPGLTSGDLIAAGFSAMASGTTFSAQTFTGPGITTGSVTERLDSIQNTTNPRVAGVFFTAAVTAGTSTGNPTMGATISAASRGTAVAVRLREFTPTGYRSIAELGTGSRTNSTIPIPNGTQVGDTMIATFRAGSGVAITIPAGWTTRFVSNYASNLRYLVAYRRYAGDANDPAGGYTFTHSSSITQATIVSVVGRHSGDPFINFVAANPITGTSISLPSTNAQSGDVFIGAGISTNSGSIISDGPHTKRTANNGMGVFTGDSLTAGPTGTINFTSSVNAGFGAWYGTLAQPYTPTAKSATDAGSVSVADSGTKSALTLTTFFNQSFETNLDPFIPVSNSDIIRDTSMSRTGAASMRFAAASSFGSTVVNTNLLPISAYGLTPGANIDFNLFARGETWEGGLSATLTFYDANGLGVGNSIGSTFLVQTSGWSSPSFTNGTVPADATQFDITLSYSPGIEGAAIWIDDISITGLAPVVDSTPISGSDTASLSVAETASISRALTASESVAISAADTSASFRTVAASESVAITATDVVENLAGQIASKAGSETTALSVAETAALFVAKTASDTTAITITDASNASTSLPGAETVALSVAETRTIAVTTAATDTVALGVSETSITFVTISAVETTALSVSDASAPSVTLSAVDSAALTIADSSSILGTNAVVGTDSISLAASETVTTAVSLSRTDTVAIGANDVAVRDKFLNQPETVALSVTETASIASTLSRTDTAALSVSETTTSFREIYAIDTSAIGATEVTSTGGNSSIPGADGATLGVDEASSIAVFTTRTDTLTVGLTETQASDVSLDSNDGGVIIGIETASLYVHSLISGTDSGALTVTETGTIDSTLSSADTAALAITDTSVSFRTMVAADSASLSVGETAGNFVVLSDEDTGALAIDESLHLFRQGVRSADELVIALDDDGGLFKAVESSDIISVALTEIAGMDSTLPGNDDVKVGLAESVAISSTGTASDSAGIALAEQATVGVFVDSADGGTLALTEQGSIFLTKSSSDGGTFLLFEVGSDSVIGAEQTTDSLRFGLAENAHVEIRLSSSDNAALVVNEPVSNVPFGIAEPRLLVSQPAIDNPRIGMVEFRLQGVTIGAAETLTLMLAESATARQSRDVTTPADSAALSVAETATVNVTVATVDNLPLRVVESTEQYGSRPGADELRFGVTESASVFVSVSATDDPWLVLAERGTICWSLYTIDTAALGVLESSHAVGKDENVVLTMVYLDGQWRNGTMVQYRKGRWRTITPYAYRNGEWYSD